jgi:hypothetical protein
MSTINFLLRHAACLALLSATAAVAQQPAYTAAGPVPPAILAAKKIFVSNAGSDSGLFPQPFTGDPNRAYTEFYADLKATGSYDLVSDPADADLVLELQLNAPEGPSNGSKQNGASDPLPMLRVVVYDRKTHFVLWALTESIEVATLQKTHDRNFDEAIERLIFQFGRITGKQPAVTH